MRKCKSCRRKREWTGKVLLITQGESLAYFDGGSGAYPVKSVGLDPKRILEIGPGAGEATMTLLQEFPGASITCLEPDDVSRAVLAWRLRDRQAGSRVSVLPLALEEAGELGGFDLLFAQHVVCEVARQKRFAFWAAMRSVLVPEGKAFVDSHFGPASSRSVSERMSASGSTGAFRVERWFSAVETSTTGRLVTNRYVVKDIEDVVVYEQTSAHEQEVISTEEELERIRANGLRHEVVDDGRWVKLRRKST